MKLRLLGFFVIILVLAASCESKPETRPAQPPVSSAKESPVAPAASAPAPAPSTPAPSVTAPNASAPRRVTQQEYTTTMQDVREFIEELNKIMAAKDYRQWRARLSPEYFARISSPEFLAEMSNSPAMKTRKIILRSAEEYFIFVVVPSRQNSRVDDIEFFGESRVIAYTINPNRAGEDVRLRMYDLERKDNSWIIIN